LDENPIRAITKKYTSKKEVNDTCRRLLLRSKTGDKDKSHWKVKSKLLAKGIKRSSARYGTKRTELKL
jgi:hypothetical protein